MIMNGKMPATIAQNMPALYDLVANQTTIAVNTANVQALIADRVRASDGRISAKRLLPIVEAAGYGGSARNLRRAVATAKAEWKRTRRHYRPWVPTPGEHLAIDWAAEYGWQIFLRNAWHEAAIGSSVLLPAGDWTWRSIEE